MGYFNKKQKTGFGFYVLGTTMLHGQYIGTLLKTIKNAQISNGREIKGLENWYGTERKIDTELV